MEQYIAKVAVEKIKFEIDKPYSYNLTKEEFLKLKPGMRIMVPFGKGQKKREAVILKTETLMSEQKNLKNIVAVLEEAPLLDSEIISLIEFMKKKYFCTYFEAIYSILPSGLKYKTQEIYTLKTPINTNLILSDKENEILNFLLDKNKPIKKDQIIKKFAVKISETLKTLVEKNILQKKEDFIENTNRAATKKIKLIENYNSKITEKQKIAINFLKQNPEKNAIKEICYYTGLTPNIFKTMQKNKIIECFDEPFFRIPYKELTENSDKEINLTNEQQETLENILQDFKNQKYNVGLLFGITGSGKTCIFLKLIDEMLKKNKNVIVLVPEIALTPQFAKIFISRYGTNVAVFHSGLCAGERLDEFLRVKENKAKIVIGTRSAVFAPIKNLGLIIMDEEQEYTYKSSDSSPRYHAREIAKFRCKKNDAMLLLASATPSLESFYFAKNGIYNLYSLKNRYGNLKLPQVEIVDLNKEQENGNFTGISEYLLKTLQKTLDKNKQAILLFNRRGYNTFASCRNCNTVVTCPNCSISMTYHSANKKLMCHYCGTCLDIKEECPNCHEKALKYCGTGTQKIEETLLKLLPSSKILRMDADTTMTKFAHQEKFKDFADGKYNIMLGTQMVAKGLNFENVNLVGVLSADQALYSEDFRSYERAFSLITQVIGRSGRYFEQGKAIIQTLTPENPIIKLAATQDYESFYEDEIKMRNLMLYPPFVHIALLGFVCLKEELARKASLKFLEIFKEYIIKNKINTPLKTLGPSPFEVFKVSGKYRYKLIIKFKNSIMFSTILKDLLMEFDKIKEYNGVKVTVNLNPDRF